MPSARPRNAEAEAEIRSCAYAMLLREGYAATSYGAIAESTGRSRAFVQHYLPKKADLMGGCLANLLARIDAAVDEARPEAEPLVAIFLTGQAYFSLLCDARLRANEAYPLGRQGAPGASDDVVRAMGGAYELLYRHLNHDGAFDPAAESMRIVGAYAASTGADAERFKEKCRKAALGERELEAMVSSLA